MTDRFLKVLEFVKHIILSHTILLFTILLFLLSAQLIELKNVFKIYIKKYYQAVSIIQGASLFYLYYSLLTILNFKVSK